MKKILTLTLSLFMAFTLCLTVSADGDKGNEGDGSSTVTQEEKTVATIGEKTYTDLKKAINEVNDNETIVLQDNITIDTISISGNKTITLDANGKTITQDYSTFEKKTYGAKALVEVSGGAKLTITGNGTFTGPGIDGKDFDGSPLVTADGNNGGAEITILNGIFTAGGSESSGMYGVYSKNGGTLILGDENSKTGPTIRSFFAAIGQNNTKSPSYITVYGGEYTTDVAPTDNEWWYYFCAPIFASATGNVSIYGGTFNGYYGISSHYANVTQNINIYGGTFNATKASLLVEDKTGTGDAGDGIRTISITGGTFSSDVSAYLATDYNIAKVNDVYKVTKNGETLPVETITPAVAEGTTETIKTSKEIKGKDSTGADATVTVNDNTQIVLASESKTLDETEVKQVEAVKQQVETIITDASKQELKYIPLDITLTAINGGTETKITDLGKTKQNNDVEITVTLYLNDANAKALKDKEVKVIRIHKNTEGGSEIAVLDAALTGNALTFTTGKFSTYVIAYAETKPTPTTGSETDEPKQESIKSYDAKDKNHDGVISCQEEMNSANWTWSETKKACVYRVTNTSAK